MLVRLQDDLQEHAVHRGELIRLPVEPSVRARQAKQDHLVATGRKRSRHKMRRRDVSGPRQLAPGDLPLGGVAQQQRPRTAPRQVLSLLQPEGLSGPVRLGSIRHRAKHPRQHRVPWHRRQHRHQRST